MVMMMMMLIVVRARARPVAVVWGMSTYERYDWCDGLLVAVHDDDDDDDDLNDNDGGDDDDDIQYDDDLNDVNEDNDIVIFAFDYVCVILQHIILFMCVSYYNI